MKCQIELLSPSILANEPDLVEEIDRMRASLGIELGWHYVLDLVWIMRTLRDLRSAMVLDAGAGEGLLQFMLTERGHSVISVDFGRRRFTLPARLLYRMKYLEGGRSEDSYLDYLRSRHLDEVTPVVAVARIAQLGFLKLTNTFRAMSACRLLIRERRTRRRKLAELLVYRSRIEKMDQLKDESVDAVVSVSALEHLDPGAIRLAMKEFERVLKPGGPVVITTVAAEAKDWFHTPSKGWCFAERSLKDLLGLNRTCLSNWSSYPEILGEIKNSEELQRRLSPIYRISGANGMPWGEWDPKYVPVGIAFASGALAEHEG